MLFRHCKHALLSLAIVGLLGTATASAAAAESGNDSAERVKSKKSGAKQEAKYPDATREEPKAKASPKMQARLTKLIKAYEKEGNEAETLALAKELIAEANANEYDKALAAQLGAQAAYNLDDTATAKMLLKQSIDLNGLSNDNHYQSMLMLAQLQLQDEQYPEGVAMLDRYLTETRSTKPDDLVLKGQALYQMEKYAEAIPVLKQAIDSSPEPKDSWYGLLLAAYAEAGQSAEAIRIAEQLVAKNPGDKKAKLNLAATQMQADQYEQAAATLEKMRAAGQMTEEKEYRQLYVTYANIDNKEKEVIAVIDDGLQKGILKPDRDVYVAQAQAYYYSDQVPKAIEAWQKGAPLAKDGEVYMNLAAALWQEGRIPEAKQAAKMALDKGVKNPQEAKKIIALP